MLAVVLALFGGLAVAAQDSIVLTQIRHKPVEGSAKCLLDSLYPPGTRLVLSKAPFATDHVRVLSEGLVSAGSPVMSYDGQQAVFAGKSAADKEWQIYQVRAEGGRPQRLTSVAGGAMQPALLPDGELVFASPVPGLDPLSSKASQLYLQSRGGNPRQITFAPTGASDPTIMPDGRILFVAARPSASSTSQGSALYTVNNDGTELTAYACQHDSPAALHHPRQLNDRRVVFLVSETLNDISVSTAEYVRTARPFSSRSKLLPDARPHIRSVQPCGVSNLLVCAEMPEAANARCAWGCFKIPCGASSLGNPLLLDPAWDSVEAIEAGASPRPMGRLSNMDLTKKTGQLLCLNVNDTTLQKSDQPAPKAARVRVIAEMAGGDLRALGEVVVQADGSFMAEVPADIPLGFEALDEQGQILRREAPSMWVRAGENRSCLGCHAEHNRAPHNHRPLAVRAAVPRLCEPKPVEPAKLANHAP